MRITVIGSGHVAFHLAAGFFRELADSVNARHHTHIDDLNNSSEVYLCAVPDDSIREVVASMSGRIPENAIVAHSSGVHGLDVFPASIRHAGVFYPLQTFTRGIPVRIADVPILIDARHKPDIGILTGLARSISDKVVTGVSKSQKAQLHLAAVFVNNFPNYLFRIASDICAANNLDFKLLRPLMLQTIHKLDFMEPRAAQTGPAIRHDRKTIEKHSALLEEHPLWTEIYALITRGIAEK